MGSLIVSCVVFVSLQMKVHIHIPPQKDIDLGVKTENKMIIFFRVVIGQIQSYLVKRILQ